jgi:hypothetical protein
MPTSRLVFFDDISSNGRNGSIEGVMFDKSLAMGGQDLRTIDNCFREGGRRDVEAQIEDGERSVPPLLLTGIPVSGRSA